ALRRAPFGGDDVDVHVAGILAAEGDPGAVRREVRVGGQPLEAREPPRRPAGAIDRPDVVGVGERDLRRAHRWRSQQLGRLAVGGRPSGEGDRQGDRRSAQSGSCHAHPPKAGDGTIGKDTKEGEGYEGATKVLRRVVIGILTAAVVLYGGAMAWLVAQETSLIFVESPRMW